MNLKTGTDMLKIFAKYGTDEKAAVYVDPRAEMRPILEALSAQHGGQWLLVDECMTSYEIVKFNDGQIYKGFDPEKPVSHRYCSAVERLNVKI